MPRLVFIRYLPFSTLDLLFPLNYSFEMVNEARKAIGKNGAVTYQLIRGSLYRSKNCPFPSRCQGIEHFLLKLAPKLCDFEIVINTYDWPHVSRYNIIESLNLFKCKEQGEILHIYYMPTLFVF